MQSSNKHILWACRRGMLELDLVLEPFAREAYDTLSSAEQVTFQRLLHCNDQELFHWFIGEKIVEGDSDLAQMVTRIREYAAQRAL